MMRIIHNACGRPVALTDEYPLVGDLLTLEAYRLNAWPFTVLLPGLQEIQNGMRHTFAFAGDAYSVHANTNTALVRLDALEQADEITIPLNELIDTIQQWQKYLTDG